MAVTTDYKGSDLLLTLKIKDSAGNYVDIETALAELYVYVVDKNNVILCKCSKSEIEGYTTLVKDDSYTYHFYLTSAQKTKADLGNLYIEIMPVTDEDELEDELVNEVGRAVLVNLKDSVIKAES